MIKNKNIYKVVTIIVATCFAVLPMSATAQVLEETPQDKTYPDIFITELQTSNETAGQEFIELYNASDVEIDLSSYEGGSWWLQYFGSTKVATVSFDWEMTAPSGAIALKGVIAPHTYFLLASTDYAPGAITPDQAYSSKFADDGGAVRLAWIDEANSQTKLFSQIGWVKTGAADRIDFVAPHPKLGSLQRAINDDNSYRDAAGVLMPWVLADVSSPGIAWQPAAPEPDPAVQTTSGIDEPEDEEPVAPDAQVPPETDVQPDAPDAGLQPPIEEIVPVPEIIQETPTVFLPIQITELLPNPAPPATDSVDEFIELYNPNEAPVSLFGYRLESGSNNNYGYVFDEVSVPAKSYIVVTSGNTPLSLANSGGHARLLDAAGVVIAQTESYVEAKDGMAWALLDGVWGWTDNVSPGLANVLPTPVPVVATAAATKAKATATKKVATKKVAAKTAAAKKTTAKTAAAKTTKAATAKAAPEDEEEELAEVTTVAPIHGGILAAAGAIAVLYGAYEYRNDIGNRIHQLRRYRAHRREART